MCVKLWGIAPDSGADVWISANDVELYRGRIDGQAISEEIELPELVGAELLLIRIRSSVFQPKGDTRTLGVAIESITLRSYVAHVLKRAQKAGAPEG